MADAAEIASLITQGIRPPSGNQDVSFHMGIVKTWDPVSGVNSVEVNGIILPNLSSLQNGMGVSYLPGDVVEVQRVQTRYTIMGRASAPNGLTGSSPASLTTNGGALSGTTGAWRDLDAGAGASPSITARIGNACLVAFGVADCVAQNAKVDISIAATGPVNIDAGAFTGWKCSAGSNYSLPSGNWIIPDFSPSKQLMFYRNTGVGRVNGDIQYMRPGVYTFFLKYFLTTYPPGDIQCLVGSPWLTVIPF